MNQRLIRSLAAAIVFFGGALVLAAPADASSLASTPLGDPVEGNSCHGYFMGNEDPSVVVATDAGPAGSSLSPGQKITVTVSWSPDSSKSEPAKVDNCVQIGGVVSDSLSQEVRSGLSGTSQRFTYIVPSNGGDELCDRGAVLGAGSATGKSPILCYTIGPSAMLPEAGYPILLPVAAVLAVGLGTIAVARSRRNLH